MPIRINLLAESQALEEMRRRDPVKRAIWVGAVLAGSVLLWAGYLQSKALVANSEVKRLEARLISNTNEYHQVMEAQRKLDEATFRLAKLQQLATNRFLNGTVLDALQHTIVDEVQLVHLRTEHKYIPVEETKQKTSEGRIVARAKAATATEKITLTLDAKDTSNGDRAVKYKEAIADCSYFQAALGKTNEVKLVNLMQAMLGPEARKISPFTLECRYPEKTR